MKPQYFSYLDKEEEMGRVGILKYDCGVGRVLPVFDSNAESVFWVTEVETGG